MTSLDKLIESYREENPQPRNLQLVTDQEADATFIRYRENFWTFIFWTMFTVSILFVGVIGR